MQLTLDLRFIMHRYLNGLATVARWHYHDLVQYSKTLGSMELNLKTLSECSKGITTWLGAC